VEVLSSEEIRELAELFDPPAAQRLLEAAGLSRRRQPFWGVATGEEFWAEVSALLAHGAGRGLRDAILAEAARLYPGNAVFARSLGRGHVGSRLRPAAELLPSLPLRYVPRPADLAALRALLMSPHAGQVVGVWAMAGAGKTTLAVALVHDPAVRDLFPDGIVWQRAGRSADLVGVLGRLLAAFGDPARVVDPVDGAHRLRALLAGARALIVLDDVWELAVVEALDLPASVRVMVTSRSREVWHADADGVELAMADEATGRRVLAAYAGDPVDDLPPAAGEVLSRCGGLILALALVGSMVRLGNSWSYVVERLRAARLDKIDASLRGYQRNLRAALEVSVQVLPAAEADRYRELALFTGSGGVPAAAAALLWRETAGLDALDAEELVGRLVQRSLVQHDRVAGTYTLHDLLFDYTRATLTRPLAELHRLVADALVRRWGGLPALPLLTGPYDETDRYGLAALVIHLLAAGDPASVDAVLAAERTGTTGRPVSVWWAAHEDLRRLGDYVAAVRAAWADARARHDHDGPASFARQAAYALLLGSVVDRAGDIPPALLARLVETGTWSVAHAVAFAQAIPAPGARAIALGGLLAHLPAGQRPSTLAQALESAAGSDNPSQRARAVVLIAPYLEAGQRTAALSEALHLALGGQPKPDSAALRTLAPYLSATDLADALDVLAAADSSFVGEEAVTVLAPHLPPDLLARALDLTLSWPSPQPGTLAALLPILPDDLLRNVVVHVVRYTPDAAAHALAPPWRSSAGGPLPALPVDLETAARIRWPDLWAAVLVRLAPQLPGHLLGAVADAALAISEPVARARALAALASHLPPQDRRSAIAAVLDSFYDVTHPPDVAEALAVLAPQIPAGLLARAVFLAGATAEGPGEAAASLAALAPHLPAELLRPALERTLAPAASAVSDDWAARQAVARLAPFLPPDLLGNAYSLVTTSTRFTAHDLTALASRLRAADRAPVAAAALTAAMRTTSVYLRVGTIAGLAAYLPADQQAQVVAAAFADAARISTPADRHRAWAQLAPWLPDDLLAQALTDAATLTDPYDRAATVARLARGVPAQDRDEVLGTALEAVADANGFPRRWSFGPDVLVTLAPHLPPSLLDRAVEIASAITERHRQAQALAAVAPRLPEDQRAAVLVRAADAALAASNEFGIAPTLRTLIPVLPDSLIGRVADAVNTLEEPTGLVLASAALAPRLPETDRAPALARALSAAHTVTNPGTRADLLITLAPHLSDKDRAPLLTELPRTIQTIDRPHLRAIQSIRLAQLLPRGEREGMAAQALETAAQAGRTAVVQILGYVAAGLPEETTAAAVAALLRVHRWWP